LLALRREMRDRSVGASQWSLGDGALLRMLLGQVLGGSLSRGGFWDWAEVKPGSRRPRAQGSWGGTFGGVPWGWGFGGEGSFQTGGFSGDARGFRTGGSFRTKDAQGTVPPARQSQPASVISPAETILVKLSMERPGPVPLHG
jgi:hypothetical protein